MGSYMQWDQRIGRRLKLRDLHVLLVTVETGSMARAARRLSISQPVVSKTISALEATIGLPLLDRTPQGIEPTVYGRALLACGTAVFDDLRRGVQELEFLADPTKGELKVGGAGPFIEDLVPAVVGSLARRYPGMEFHVVETDAQTLCELLLERKIDLALCRPPETPRSTDVAAEYLFEETMVVVAGRGNRWFGRRRVNLADIVEEPWVFPESDNVAATFIADAFRSSGFEAPKPRVRSNSVAVRMRLVESAAFLTVLPRSMLHFGSNRIQVKSLPISFPTKSAPAEIITVKNRTPSAMTSIFVEELRSYTKNIRRAARKI